MFLHLWKEPPVSEEWLKYVLQHGEDFKASSNKISTGERLTRPFSH